LFLASARLEAILKAIFEAEFCPPGEKRAREQARDALLQMEAERVTMPAERLKLAILSSRYPAYRRNRLARELLSVPPKVRRQ